MTTRNFADVIRAKLAADPELAAAVESEAALAEYLQAIAKAVAAEREACAKVADMAFDDRLTHEDIAAAIRARKDPRAVKGSR